MSTLEARLQCQILEPARPESLNWAVHDFVETYGGFPTTAPGNIDVQLVFPNLSSFPSALLKL